MTRPKSLSSNRIIPIPPFLVQYLNAHRNATLDEPNPYNLVWHYETGQPLHPRNDYESWVQLLKAAGLPHVKLHSCRHTAASVLAALNMDRDTIRRVLGHSSLDMTAIYADVDRAAVRDFMNQMSGKIIAGEVIASDRNLTTPVPQIG